MTFEVEHKPGATPEDMERAEKELKKDVLAQQMGITREKFDSLINEAKGFFTAAELEARKHGRTTIKRINDEVYEA